jgi:hypothetical protein
MINHISIAVDDPKRVANVLAEIWDGVVYPFPPSPGAYVVLANDGRGTTVEVTTAGTTLVPGEGYPPEENFSIETPTEEYEAKFVKNDAPPRYVATHLNLNTSKSVNEIKAIADREGWRVLTCNRGEGLFQVIEFWVEDRFLLEVMTPEMTDRYVEIMNPEFIDRMFADQLAQPPAEAPAENLNLIG